MNIELLLRFATIKLYAGTIFFIIGCCFLVILFGSGLGGFFVMFGVVTFLSAIEDFKKA